jgi:hypothetical protein
MNSALRNRDRQQVELFKHYIWLLFHALWYAPVYKGRTLFRARPKAASHYADTTTKGAKYTDYSFTSTTQQIAARTDFVAGSLHNTQWVYDIHPSYARDIKIFSHHVKESEVLLLPGIQFHVKDQVKHAHGRVTEVQAVQVSSTHALSLSYLLCPVVGAVLTYLSISAGCPQVGPAFDLESEDWYIEGGYLEEAYPKPREEETFFASRIGDALRASVTVADAKDLHYVWSQLSSKFEVVRMKNKFSQANAIITHAERADAQLLADLIDVQQGMLRELSIKDRQYHGRVYQDCFVGSEAVDWFISRRHAATREEGVAIGECLVGMKLIRHVVGQHQVGGLEVQPVQSVSGLQVQPVQSVSGLQVQPVQSVSGLQVQPVQSVSGLQVQPVQSVSGLEVQPV